MHEILDILLKGQNWTVGMEIQKELSGIGKGIKWKGRGTRNWRELRSRDVVR